MIGAWKFLSAGPRIWPKFTGLFSFLDSMRVGSGDKTTGIHNMGVDMICNVGGLDDYCT